MMAQRKREKEGERAQSEEREEEEEETPGVHSAGDGDTSGERRRYGRSGQSFQVLVKE